MNVAIVAVAGFASGWMLLWAAAAAIPVILHFLYRRRQVILPWAAMQLLSQVIQKEAKRVRIEQLLLLLLRTLILLTLAIALARPYWDRDDASAVADSGVPAVTWILAIDVSYSMGYQQGAPTRLEAAQDRAVEIVEAANDGDAFALVALGRPPQAMITQPTFDRPSVLAEIRRLALNDAGCDLTSGLQLVSDMAQAAQREEVLPTMIRIVILSDLGEDQWQTVVDGAQAKYLSALASNYQLSVESLGNDDISNIAVTSIRPSTVRAVVGLPLEVDVTLANYGAAAVEQLPVQMVVDGETVASQYLDLQSNTSGTVRFTVALKTVGRTVITAQVPKDRLEADNRRSHIVDVRDAYDMLFVEQQSGDARILRLSLRPEKSARTTRKLSTLSVVELPAADLSQWQVVVLDDLKGIDRISFANLERFARQGGAVLCLFGPRTEAAAWNMLEESAPLLGFQLREPSPVGDWTIDPLEYQSPVVAPFAGFPDAGLLTTPIFRFWQINGSDTSGAFITDLATTDGQPLIVRHPLGEGCVASLLSAPQSGAMTESPWNAMATWPSFVPLIQKLVQAAMDTREENHTVLAGQPLIGREQAGSAWRDQGMQLVKITKPDGSESQIAAEDVTSEGWAPWFFAPTYQHGVYYAGSTSRQEEPYAVNIDPVESPLRSVKRSLLPASVVRAPVVGQPRDMPEEARERSPIITRIALSTLGLLLVAESLLAWWLGRRTG